MAEYNRTRTISARDSALRSERYILLNKTRIKSEQERKEIAERMSANRRSGRIPDRGPMPESEKAMHSQRLKDHPIGIGIRNIPSMHKKGKNKSESRLDAIISAFGFKFVGDGQFWIGPCVSGLNRNPDFIYQSGKLKIAILSHGDYWHGRKKAGEDAAELNDYDMYGWRVLVIWENECRWLKQQASVRTRVCDWLKSLGVTS
jgi:G:T-mismatch repair DNA endonuclease (very short patch repair protein)